jgi:hypothetical protein
MLDAVIQGFLLGLSAGIGCVAFCAPLLGPLFLLRSRATWGYSATALMEFLAGRLARLGLRPPWIAPRRCWLPRTSPWGWP